MKWIELCIKTSNEYEETLSYMLNEMGSKGVTIEHSIDIIKQKVEDFERDYRLDPKDYPDNHMVIKAYFNELEFDQDIIDEVLSNISSYHLPIHREDITTQSINEQDWENEWKQYYHPIEIGNQFVIEPSWEKYDQQTSRHVISLDPGMAFGTGDHATTSMCLEMFEQIEVEDKDVIDVGTGSGILSIGAHHLKARSIEALDVDRMAVKVAKENFELNDCLEHINVHTGDLLKDIPHDSKDIVIANILAHIIDLMIEDAHDVLRSGGYFISSGIIDEKCEEIKSRLDKVGFEVVDESHKEGWTALLARKRDQ